MECGQQVSPVDRQAAEASGGILVINYWRHREIILIITLLGEACIIIVSICYSLIRRRYPDNISYT